MISADLLEDFERWEMYHTVYDGEHGITDASVPGDRALELVHSLETPTEAPQRPVEIDIYIPPKAA